MQLCRVFRKISLDTVSTVHSVRWRWQTFQNDFAMQFCTRVTYKNRIFMGIVPIYVRAVLRGSWALTKWVQEHNTNCAGTAVTGLLVNKDNIPRTVFLRDLERVSCRFYATSAGCSKQVLRQATKSSHPTYTIDHDTQRLSNLVLNNFLRFTFTSVPDIIVPHTSSCYFAPYMKKLIPKDTFQNSPWGKIASVHPALTRQNPKNHSYLWEHE